LEFAEFLGGGGWFHVEGLVKGFDGCVVVGDGADTADSGGEQGQSSARRPMQNFSSRGVQDFEVGVFYVALVVEEYGYVSVSFKPCDWVYCYSFIVSSPYGL
jgi:hypothetical protein